MVMRLMILSKLRLVASCDTTSRDIQVIWLRKPATSSKNVWIPDRASLVRNDKNSISTQPLRRNDLAGHT